MNIFKMTEDLWVIWGNLSPKTFPWISDYIPVETAIKSFKNLSKTWQNLKLYQHKEILGIKVCKIKIINNEIYNPNKKRIERVFKLKKEN